MNNFRQVLLDMCFQGRNYRPCFIYSKQYVRVQGARRLGIYTLLRNTNADAMVAPQDSSFGEDKLSPIAS